MWEFHIWVFPHKARLDTVSQSVSVDSSISSSAPNMSTVSTPSWMLCQFSLTHLSHQAYLDILVSQRPGCLTRLVYVDVFPNVSMIFGDWKPREDTVRYKDEHIYRLTLTGLWQHIKKHRPWFVKHYLHKDMLGYLIRNPLKDRSRASVRVLNAFDRSLNSFNLWPSTNDEIITINPIDLWLKG